MKRTVCLLLACLLLCGAAAMALSMNEVSGAWTLSAVDIQGISYTPAEANVSMLLLLDGNGSGSLDSGEGTIAITWELNGTQVIIDNGSLLCEYDAFANQLVIERSGLTLRLSRADR